MRTEEMKEIRQRVEAATPAPWGRKDKLDPFGKPGLRDELVGDLDGQPSLIALLAVDHARNSPFELADANGELIAHARKDIPDLLDHIASQPDRIRAAVAAETKRCENIAREWWPDIETIWDMAINDRERAKNPQLDEGALAALDLASYSIAAAIARKHDEADGTETPNADAAG